MVNNSFSEFGFAFTSLRSIEYFFPFAGSELFKVEVPAVTNCVIRSAPFPKRPRHMPLNFGSLFFPIKLCFEVIYERDMTLGFIIVDIFGLLLNFLIRLLNVLKPLQDGVVFIRVIFFFVACCLQQPRWREALLMRCDVGIVDESSLLLRRI